MERIGKYEIGRKIGQGATSTVFLGYDPFARRDVAIKVFAPEVLRDARNGRIFRHLLKNEASLAGKLLHPHIAQIYDAVVGEESSYIVMEYVSGGTLESFCHVDNLLPLERLVETIFKCTRALDYACRMGVIHRDIKPANILLASPMAAAGDIKISDFGNAFLTSGDSVTQVVGVGSPAYMSPQQLQESAVDHRTDIWSLGVVMYQLLTARLPFMATNNYALIHEICNIDPAPPSNFRSDVPARLDGIVARAMKRNLDERYAAWDDFSHDLAEVFRSGALASHPESFADTQKFEGLRSLRFFDQFSDPEIWEVVRFSRWESVAADAAIMADGTPGDTFCLLFEGELAVVKRGRHISALLPGDCFGEMAVIGHRGHVRSADVVARTAAKVITISGAALRQASDVCRMHFYEAFLDVLAGRLALANAWMSSA
ncbi:MAG: serine/threonine-protein kinase [Rhodocyclaceae bacterium]|nr:serine/threonine-protein kinase [Rhodocyclaceae bacterium]